MRIRTMAILRHVTPEAARELAEISWGAGIDVVEVPVQGREGWEALEAVAEVANGRLLGAGSVLDRDQVTQAVRTGARVIVSPGLDHDVVAATRALDAFPLPGVFTATEVMAALRLGLGTCKLFPASVVGPGWLRALRAPFPDISLVAVGGVDFGNAAEYIEAGATGVGVNKSVIAKLHQMTNPAAHIRQIHTSIDRFSG